MENEKVKEIKQYRKRKKRKFNVLRLLIIAFLLIVIILGVLFLTLYNTFDLPYYLLYSFNVDKQLDKKEILRDIGDNNYYVHTYNDTIVMCSQDGAKGVNENGETLWAVSYNTLNPVFYSQNGNVLIYERENRKLYYLNNNFKLKEYLVEDNIVSANVNSSGYVSIVSEEKGFKGKVTIFNPEGEEVYIWHSSENYIIDSAVSEDGLFFSVSVLNDKKGKLSGGIVSFKMNSTVPQSAIDTGDNIITKVNYISSSIAAIGDSQALILNNEGIIEWTYEYSKLGLSDFGFDYNNSLLTLSLNDKDGIGNNKSKIVWYNVVSKEKKEYDSEINIDGIDIKNNNILYYSKHDISLINNDGLSVLNKAIDKDIVKALIFKNTNKILVVTKNDLEIVEITN